MDWSTILPRRSRIFAATRQACRVAAKIRDRLGNIVDQSMAGNGHLFQIVLIHRFRAKQSTSDFGFSQTGTNRIHSNRAGAKLGASAIRVNSVCPGLAETEIASGLLGTESVYEDYLKKMPIARHGLVNDIAEAVAYLCSDAASLPRRCKDTRPPRQYR